MNTPRKFERKVPRHPKLSQGGTFIYQNGELVKHEPCTKPHAAVAEQAPSPSTTSPQPAPDPAPANDGAPSSRRR